MHTAPGCRDACRDRRLRQPSPGLPIFSPLVR
jgi:hypothetical protein